MFLRIIMFAKATGASIILSFVVFALLTKSVQTQTTESPSLCKEIRCSFPPETYECSITKSDHPKIEKRLGPLKDCCPVYFCMNGTGEKFLFVGLNDKNYSESAKPKPVYKTSDIETCESTNCPKVLQNEDVCVSEQNPDDAIKEFAKDAISCCPVMNCTNSEGTFLKFSVLEGSLPPIEDLEEDSKHCEEFTCATKPVIKGSTCAVLQGETVMIADVLGNLKNCCPIWECIHPDGSIYDHFQIQGNEFRYKEIRTRQRSEPEENRDTKKCKSDETCPKLKKDLCSYENTDNLDFDKFVPEEEKCCSLMRCEDEDGKKHTHYVKLWGNIPTTPTDISKVKGKPSNKKNCPKISCASKSKTHKQTNCSPYVGRRPLLPKMKPFSSCCDMLKCFQSDGSYSIELSMNATTFNYFEISFFDIDVTENDNDNILDGEKTSGSTRSHMGQNRVSSKQSNPDKGLMTMVGWVPQMMAQSRKAQKNFLSAKRKR